ncbi:PhnD/SsuA/transferrin family substrate-binding protein [Rhodobacter sp. CZR27]|uniref:substrate-binding domain-containing protein n=1 Tax=Rhodobacter sp. CZR27 TaxID=2033869 RepID=UPI000BBF2AB7|nr:PhnD/SsuA/transferrin family substrate-binding protein [Rhodobacter sp. CZR27]
MAKHPTRRRLIGMASVGLAAPSLLRASPDFRLGLTPVFLDNEAVLLHRLRFALSEAIGDSVSLVQRRTYQEVVGLLLEGSVSAAWICGYPFLQHEDVLELVGVPVWRGQPLYRSCLIVQTGDAAGGLADLRGGIHAFSDPDSNSGWLVTASDLARMGETPERYFGRTFFTYGHRNVVRAVGAGLARSGSVDGYVWEALAAAEPGLVQSTRVIARSEPMGFPPFACRRDGSKTPEVRRFREALLTLRETEAGRAALGLLQLDGVVPGAVALFDPIAQRMRELGAAR